MTLDDFRFMRDARSRRDFFRVSGLTAVGGSAVFIAACGEDDDEAADSSTDSGGAAADVGISSSCARHLAGIPPRTPSSQASR